MHSINNLRLNIGILTRIISSLIDHRFIRLEKRYYGDDQFLVLSPILRIEYTGDILEGIGSASSFQANLFDIQLPDDPARAE